MPRSLLNYWQWYQHLTGLDKVEFAKQEVITVQEKMFRCQDQRRLFTQQAVKVSEKLKEIYSELIQTRRDDPKYVQLTILENKNLQEQVKINEKIELLENEERDFFTQLTTAIKEYHDSQAMNAQKYKYLSILGSAILAIISLSGSIFYNNKRIADVRNVVSEAQNAIENNVNEKFSIIVEQIENHGNYITSALNISSLNKMSVSSIETVKSTNNVIDDNFPQDAEKIKQTAYYLMIGLCTVYLIQKIFQS